jgi:hypothetical protein
MLSAQLFKFRSSALSTQLLLLPTDKTYLKFFYTIFLQHHGKYKPWLLGLRSSVQSFQLLLLAAVKVHLLFLSTSFFTVSRHVKFLTLLVRVKCLINSATASDHRQTYLKVFKSFSYSTMASLTLGILC